MPNGEEEVQQPRQAEPEPEPQATGDTTMFINDQPYVASLVVDDGTNVSVVTTDPSVVLAASVAAVQDAAYDAGITLAIEEVSP